MPPEGYYSFWDKLMDEQGVKVRVAEEVWRAPNYNVGDVLVGEIVDEPLEIEA